MEQTFLRQKITLASSTPASVPGSGGSKDPGMKNNVDNSRGSSNSSGVGVIHTFRSTDQAMSMMKTESPIFTGYDNQSENGGIEHKKTAGSDNSTPSTLRGSDTKFVHSPVKINGNTMGSGVLRYALHLRFLCPRPKKSSRTLNRCKSDPLPARSSKDMEIEGERRFYMYNDMRVVFPQRRSDADEGKVCHRTALCCLKCLTCSHKIIREPFSNVDWHAHPFFDNCSLTKCPFVLSKYKMER